MSQERMKILNMLQEQKISATEAETLLNALGENSNSPNQEMGAPKAPPKFLRILVDAEGKEKGKAKVNVKVPLAILRAGIKLSSFFPDSSSNMDSKFHTEFERRGLNVNFSKMSTDDVEAFISALQESEIVIDADQNDHESAKIRLFCE